MAVGTLRQICVGSVCTVAPHPENAYRPYALRHPVLAFVSAFLVITKLGGVALVALTPDVASLATISSSVLVRETNKARAAAGLPALEEHPLLVKSAAKKAADMLAHDYFEHTSPAGVTPWKWFDEAGYAYVYAGENLAIDFTAAEAVHTAWMRSPGHKKNIVSDKYRQIGIAVATGEFEGRTTTVVVQHFGSLSAGAVAKQPTAPTAAPAEPTRALAPTATPIPTATPRPTAVPTIPPPPPPPQILEPSEGQILPSGASTVRGISERDTTVHLALDGTEIGTYETSGGIFAGTFELPPEEEREAVLSATASREGKRSNASAPRRILLDTRGPRIAESDAVYLPHPSGIPGRAFLFLPVEPGTVEMAATVNEIALPVSLRDSFALVDVPLADSNTPLALRATDASRNIRTTTVQPARSYHTIPRTAGEADARIRVLTTTSRVQNITTWVLAVVGFLLLLNVFIYIRIQHADLIVHTVFVLALGTLLLLTT